MCSLHSGGREQERLDNIIGGFALYQRLQSSNDDDAFDRLNHIYTVTLLFMFSIFVSGKEFVGNPIECFSQQEELKLGKLAYAQVYCWLRNTYTVPGPDGYANNRVMMPETEWERRNNEIRFYQWVPILLLVMAGLFKLPNLIWRVCSLSSGIDLSHLSSLVISSQCAPTDKYRATVKQVAEYMDRWLEGHRPCNYNVLTRTKKFFAKRMFIFPMGKRFGTYLTGLSLVTKLLFACVDVSIFFLMQHVMGDWYSLYGFKLLSSLAASSGDPTVGPRDSPYFPKVAFCDIDIRQMANVQRLTLQCVLPINIFNEKIFAFLWFWMFGLSVITIGNLIYWTVRWTLGRLHYREIECHLRSAGYVVTDAENQLAHRFVHKYLRRDGAFVLGVILNNSSAVMVKDLVIELWLMYTKCGRDTNSGGGKVDPVDGGTIGARKVPTGKVQGDILYI